MGGTDLKASIHQLAPNFNPERTLDLATFARVHVSPDQDGIITVVIDSPIYEIAVEAARGRMVEFASAVSFTADFFDKVGFFAFARAVRREHGPTLKAINLSIVGDGYTLDNEKIRRRALCLVKELAYAALQKRRRKAPVAPCLGFDPAIACALLVDDLPGVTSNLPVINLKVIGEITQADLTFIDPRGGVGSTFCFTKDKCLASGACAQCG